MPKKTLTKIITITTIIWFIGTAIYALISISTEISRTEFFPILVIVYFVTGKLPLFIIGLIIVVVIELTVWAMLPEGTER